MKLLLMSDGGEVLDSTDEFTAEELAYAMDNGVLAKILIEDFRRFADFGDTK